MRLLSIDPSSTATGWALLQRGDVQCMGVIKSSKKDYWDRIVIMGDGVLNLARMYQPAHIVIESSSKHVNRSHRGGGAGLAHYGEAVGAVCAWLVARGYPIHRVPANEWTSGYKSIGNRRKKATKEQRQTIIGIEFPKYMAKAVAMEDRGMDISDAIALGSWWLREKAQHHLGDALSSAT